MVKCKSCGGDFESYQMKTSGLCNICAYEKNSKRDYIRTKNKFRAAIRF